MKPKRITKKQAKKIVKLLYQHYPELINWAASVTRKLKCIKATVKHCNSLSPID